MPTVPGSRFIDKQPSLSTPARSPVYAPVDAFAGPAAAVKRMGDVGMDLTTAIAEAQRHIQQVEDTATAQDAINSYHQRAREYTEQKRGLVGVNAKGVSQQATADLTADYTTTLESLPNDHTKKLFKTHAFVAKESFLTTIASHELTQLEKYRTDTLNAAFQNAAEDIKLSTGDPAIVKSVVESYEAQVEALYPDQNTTQLKLQHKALLEKAGREAQEKYVQTAAFDIVRAKFTKPDKAGNPVMDYAAAKNYLLDNPDKVPEISHLTIEKRTQLADTIWADGLRYAAQKKEDMGKTAGTMWSSYDKLLRGVPLDPGEPQSFQEWHLRAEQLTEVGGLDESVLKTAISYTKAEQLQKKGEEAAIRIQERQEIAAKRAQEADIRARERFSRETNPLMQSNLDVLARFNSRIATDPASVPVSEVIGTIGKGLSIDDAIKLSDKIKGAPGKLWNGITGQSVRKILNDYWKNGNFYPGSSTESVAKNNAAYNDTMTYFQGWLEKNPSATPEDADKEMRRVMYPFLRGWFKQKYDSITGNDPILSKE